MAVCRPLRLPLHRHCLYDNELTLFFNSSVVKNVSRTQDQSMRLMHFKLQSQGECVPNEAIIRLGQHLSDARKALCEIEIQSGNLDAARSARDLGDRQAIALDAALIGLGKHHARHTHFGSPVIFGSPAWDILLSAHVCEARHQKMMLHDVRVKGQSADISLRWFCVLEEHGFMRSFDDPDQDKQRLVQMTDKGREVVMHYLLQPNCR